MMKKNQFTLNNFIWLLLIVVIFALIGVLISLGIIDGVYETLLMTVGINIILAISLNLIIGITGQFSLGHAGFMSVGAYAAGVFIKHYGQGPSTFYFGLLAGMILSALVSLVIAIPTLRLRGDYLAIATLGFGEIIKIIMQNAKITNGAAGLILPKLVDWKVIFIFVVLSTLVVLSIRYSRYGRACISVRENEIASEAMGINTTKYKVLVFVIGAMLASVAGSLYAGSFFVIKPDMFSFNKSIDILVLVVFGGMGSFTGSFLSSFLIGLLNTTLQQFSDIRTILYGALLVIIMIFRPQGLLGTKEFSLRTITDKLGKKVDK